MNWGKVTALALAGIVGLSGWAVASPAASQEAGSVYLLRGGWGIFSTGLNELGEKLQAAGIPAKVEQYGNWREYVADIVKRIEAGEEALPVVIMGHSFGANAVLLMAAKLGEMEVPVALAVTFDISAFGNAFPPEKFGVTRNVGHIINFFVGGVSAPIKPTESFQGTIENINVTELGRGIGHMNMEEDEGLHQRVIDATLRAFGKITADDG